MNAPSELSLINPFQRGETPSCAVVRDRISAMQLEPLRKRDLLSALRRLEQWLGRDLRHIPADLDPLRKRLAALEPPQLGISRKTFSTVRSNLLSAIELSEVASIIRTARLDYDATWRELLGSLPQQRLRAGLSRLGRFCSHNRISPNDVDTAVIEALGRALRSGSFARHANTTERDTATLWNRLVDLRPELNLNRIIPPSFRGAPKRVLWTDLPATFRDSVDAYCSWAVGSDPFAPDARAKPLAASTIRHRRQQIHTAADAFVRAGHDVSELCELRDLFTPAAFKAIMRLRLADNVKAPKRYDLDLARTLVAIAKECLGDQDPTIAELKTLMRKIGPSQGGLTQKNKMLLSRFSDGDQLDRLLEMPGLLWRNSLMQPLSERSLATMQAALAINILLHLPLRISNLTKLEFERTLFLPKSDDQETQVSIPAYEMKNRKDFDGILPPHVTKMLRIYRDKTLRQLPRAPSAWIFVNEDGTLKLSATMSYLIARTLRSHLGIAMTAHQFRHLAAKIILDEDPGALLTVQALLGHSSLKTTAAFYAGLDTARAGRVHADLLQAHRKKREEQQARRSSLGSSEERRSAR